MRLALLASVLFPSLLLAQEPLILEKAIELPGVEGRFDHAAADPATHRLFFAALGNNSLEIVDLNTGQRLHTIQELRKPTGVLFLSDYNLLVIANGDDGTCRFIDGSSYKEKGRINGLEDADNLRFDPKAKRIYLGYGEGALGIIDPVAMKLTGSIALPKHPESFQLEENGPRIFVNVPDAQQVVVVDRAVGKVVANWAVKDFRANFPMALDEKDHRLFIGCRQPARLLSIDTNSGKRVGEAPLSGDIDDLFFDHSSSQLYASCGDGFIDVFQYRATDNLTRTHQLRSAPGARTAFFSNSLGRFCLAVPHRAAQGAEIRVYRTSDAPH
ncbi:YncE family protein [Verrucomicrobiota bacterium sgz303538]